MKTDLLKQTEIFIFLALVFSIFTAAVSNQNRTLGETLEDKENECEIYKACCDSTGNSSVKCSTQLIRIIGQLDTCKNNLIKCRDSLEIVIGSKPRKLPPAIPIQDANGKNYFPSGSAKPSPRLEKYVAGTVIPKLKQHISEHSDFNTIVITGHTDHRPLPIGATNENFEHQVVEIYQTAGFKKISTSSNLELGFLRAITVYQLLRRDSYLKKHITYWHPLSAGPFIHEDSNKLVHYIDRLDEPKKRRIEIQIMETQKSSK